MIINLSTCVITQILLVGTKGTDKKSMENLDTDVRVSQVKLQKISWEVFSKS